MKKEEQKNYFDVVVVGGGASGMMAAGIAAARGKRVLILEKNKLLGEKLKISGGGRCNITNAEFDTRTLLKNYGQADKFLFSPFSKFGVKETIDFFEQIGLPIVVQARKRAFPASEKASDVFLVLSKYMKKGGVTIKADARVSRVLSENGSITGIVAGGTIYNADSYIIATGGLSHPETGSTGDGFDWLRSLGHKVENPTPSLVPLKVKEEWVKSLSGISLSFMKITFFCDKVKKFSKKGKVLFTHFGLSGPLILNSAAQVSDLLQEGKVTAMIDAYPDTDISDLENKIIKIFDANKNKMLKNVFDDIVPHGTVPAIVSLLEGIDPDTKVHSITKEQRKQIVQLLKALPVTITELMGYEKAIVADGGISLIEIDTSTMRSKLFKNLYVTGDLLHVQRPSGGYSLQLCWTTGFVAGSNA